MLHAREDYMRIQDPAGLIPEEEPVFLLRARDQLAPHIVMEWARMAEKIDVDPEMIKAAVLHADKMFKWQEDNGSKVPDLPTKEENCVKGDGAKMSMGIKRNERFLLAEASREIKMLRGQNQQMAARLDMFDKVMMLVHTQPGYQGQGMSPAVEFEIDNYLQKNQ